MNAHETFTTELMAEGWQVDDYERRAGDSRPSVRVDGEEELQAVIRATSVIVTWDTLGMGWIVYPASRAPRENA